MKVSFVFSNLLHLFFPQRCIFCGCLTAPDIFCCEPCKIKIDRLPITEQALHIRQEYPVDSQLIAPFYYSEATKDAILQFKFNNRHAFAKPLGHYVAQSIQQRNLTIDGIIPAPLHPADLRKRGYNQSYLLARAIAKECGIPVLKNCLRKVRRTKKQHNIHAQERKINLKGAFALKNASQLENKTILFLDDVYTTGSTVKECCAVLACANPKRIHVAVIGKTLK